MDNATDDKNTVGRAKHEVVEVNEANFVEVKTNLNCSKLEILRKDNNLVAKITRIYDNNYTKKQDINIIYKVIDFTKNLNVNYIYSLDIDRNEEANNSILSEISETRDILKNLIA